MLNNIHIYDGDGKGKTSSGLGLLLRANGAGTRTCAFFFLKNASSSEIGPLRKLGIPCFPSYEEEKYFWQMSEDEKDIFRDRQKELFLKAREHISDAEGEVILLDEILDLPALGILKEEDIKDLLKDPRNEIILTGRDGAPYMDQVSYHTHMQKVKHPYDQGQEARKGIEY